MAAWHPEAFVGGHPSLDFANTAGGSGKERDIERLARFADAARWARAAGLLDEAETAALVGRAEADPAAATAALDALHAQREALHAFLLAALDGTPPPPAVRRRVETDLTTAYAAARLSERLDAAEAWSVGLADAGLHLIARRLALATGSLLAGAGREHVRVCRRCSWMFLDPSPTKRRRWCSMATCGNRAKAERHYRRTAGAG